MISQALSPLDKPTVRSSERGSRSTEQPASIHTYKTKRNFKKQNMHFRLFRSSTRDKRSAGPEEYRAGYDDYGMSKDKQWVSCVFSSSKLLISNVFIFRLWFIFLFWSIALCGFFWAVLFSLPDLGLPLILTPSSSQVHLNFMKTPACLNWCFIRGTSPDAPEQGSSTMWGSQMDPFPSHSFVFPSRHAMTSSGLSKRDCSHPSDITWHAWDPKSLTRNH